MSQKPKIGGYMDSSKVIRPFCLERLQGLAAYDNDRFIILDSDKGYLATVDTNNNTTLINPDKTHDFRHALGIDHYDGQIWYAKNKRILKIKDDLSGDPEVFTVLKPKPSGVVVTHKKVYVATVNNRIYVFENSPNGGEKLLKEYDAPGVSADDITVHKGDLWVCDGDEQTIYCLDPDTGGVKFNLLVPFESPTGIAFLNDELYVSYSNEECSIRDDGAGENLNLVADTHSRNFIHRLRFRYDENEHYTLSGGYLIEASYVEEIDPVRDARDIEDKFEWLIGLPATTKRQQVLDIQPIGKEFTIREEDDQKYAVFQFDKLDINERYIFGWKALLKVRAIKYNLTPDIVGNDSDLPDKFKKYLEDDGTLAMDKSIVKKAARKATKDATNNILDKVLKIRNYVYGQLTYNMEGGIDRPDVVLKRGDGSCGEYLGVLMALTRLNGIASRDVGRYKVPYYKINPETRNVPIEPDFNHVWLEFYVPGLGWIPMESSADDNDTGKWTMRYFMGLQWYHIELQRGLPFEDLMGTKMSVGDLSRNHIRFRILEELD